MRESHSESSEIQRGNDVERGRVSIKYTIKSTKASILGMN